MKSIILTAEVFSAIILSIVLYASISETTSHTRKDRVFSLFAGVNLLMLMMDAVSWIIDGKNVPLPVSWTITLITIIGAYPAGIFFGEYLDLHLAERGVDVHRLQVVSRGYGIAAMVLTTIGSLLGAIYTFENGRYADGAYYGLYMISVIPIYGIQIVMARRGLNAVERHDKIAFLGYAIMPVITMLIAMVFPELSISYPGMAISILLVYVMLQSGQKMAAAVRERVLTEKSYTDDLTGIGNRRSFLEHIEKIRPEEYISLAFCDVNGLKYINDNMGHSEGDRLLRTVAERLVEKFGADHVFRISGDEFVIVLTGALEGDLAKRAQSMVEEIRRNGYDPLAVGTAEGPAADLKALQTRAEEAMYATKAVFHRKFPEYVRGGSLFIRDILDDSNNERDDRNEFGLIENNMAFAETDRVIVIVESNSEERRLLHTLLGDSYDLVDTDNAAEALQILRQDPRNIAMVLINVREPDISGIELMRNIQAEKQLAVIPVIVTKEELRRSDEREYLRLGVFDCIQRPYSPDILLNRVRRTIELRESLTVLAEMELDELTGIYTHQAFNHHAKHLLSRDETEYDLTVLDVVDFKGINRGFGENRGDAVLRHIGRCIQDAMMGYNARYGRYGGDIFIIMTESGSFAEEQREELARRIEDQAPVSGVTVKFGTYRNVPRDLTPSDLCDCAIAALATVKHQYGVRTGFYDINIRQKMSRMRRLEADMGSATVQKRFKVFYQPKHDARTGRLAGAEALIRWEHPEFGFLSPDEFIPMFESSGFIRNADLYVWQRTCENLNRWRKMGLETGPISVNASRLDFSEPEFMQAADNARREYGLKAKDLHIEITDSAFVDSEKTFIDAIKKARAMGYRIEMDDFGTGLSTLNSLGTLPVDILKMDRKFVWNASMERSRTVLASCIAMAHELNVRVLSEGVETDEQLDMLREMGCDEVQGYYYARPMNEDDFEAYIRKNSAAK